MRGANDSTLDWVLFAASCGVLLLAALLNTPDGTQVVIPGLGLALPEFCYARRWLGIDCPGCGLTRSFIAIMHGDLNGAWQFNPAGLAVFAAVACQIPYRGWHLAWHSLGKPGLRMTWLSWIWVAIGAALVIQWLARF